MAGTAARARASAMRTGARQPVSGQGEAAELPKGGRFSLELKHSRRRGRAEPFHGTGEGRAERRGW